LYNRLQVSANVDQTEELDRSLIEREWEGYLSFNGRRESFLQYGGGWRTRVFNGIAFDQQFQGAAAQLRLSGDLQAGVNVNWGEWIDFAHARAADERTVRPFVNLNYGRHVSVTYGHLFNTLEVEGGRLLSAHVPEVRVVYQHDARTLFRAILQYTGVARETRLYANPVAAESRDLFAQLLFSYKINAQTALYVGYVTGASGTDQFALTPANRTFFSKVSYAWLR
jgi:hypothetical protein